MKLKLDRGNYYIDKLRDYKIFINDEFYGVIANDSTLFFENIPKNSTIQVKVDWCTSNKYHVCTEIQNIELCIEPTCKGWKLSLWFLYITLFRNQYMRISSKK
ncbi:hypothetical protein Fleli_1091 [Bernardetia litoralis DSM 6794]|uniref:Uncharacterized protein n=1 Tax=Bernardetia litoralis (strain ATCC 23117 / DSM 6794 / NBRC 15988 / NCIMB 1366 / Fx l1 / Sio-4) TaxID=880071 RepID=I4AHU4_BERLS|nr:hypothetical protein Fleli_1091 [Bernardetia litoralis DSM 6794]